MILELVAMMLFFALVAKEIVEAMAPGGMLHAWRRTTVPVIAAAGATILPALLFIAFVRAVDEPMLERGWTVTFATDVALAYVIARLIFPKHPAVPFVLLLALAADAFGFIALAIFHPYRDLEYLPRGVHVTAVDVTPAMLDRLRRRAQSLDVRVETHVMDARRLTFGSGTFDAVVLHLTVAAMPQPERGVAEAVRVVKPGGRIAIFDKFLGDDERASIARRAVNLIMKPMFSDMNRRLGPLLDGKEIEVERDEPGPFGGMYRIVTLRKPEER